jgi:adenine-specific DNA-methyltransferase
MTQPPTYGSHNPHPLSTLRTELVWEGKYDEYGNRREVDIAGCAMPMQRIESIDELVCSVHFSGHFAAMAATGQGSPFKLQNPKQDDCPHPLTPSPKPGEGGKHGSAPLSQVGRGAGGEG